MPAKLERNLRYIQTRTLTGDLWILWKTVMRIVGG